MADPTAPPTFDNVDLSGAVFREVDLTGARMLGVVLRGADIDGDLTGLRLNGVEVAPLIEAELDRLHPERTKLRPRDPAGALEALATVESFWAPTMRRAAALSDADRHRSVNGEWSLAQTLRHLVFVTDSWFGHAVLGERAPFHPIALPAGFSGDGASYGIDADAAPTFDEIVAVRNGRIEWLRSYLSTVTQEELERVREPNLAPGWPPPGARTALHCLNVIFNEEWAHHQFAVRDLAIIEAGQS